ASQFAKQKNYTEAFKTSQKITENNSKVFAFLEIGTAFFENSEPEKAFEVLSFALNTTLKITEPTQKIDFLLEIAKKYFVFGEFEKAKQTLLQALNLAKTLVNFQTQNDQFKKIAVAFAQTKNFTESFQTNDLINENPSFKIEILSEISKVSFAFGDKKNASETLDKAFSLISGIEDFETKTKFFENISLDYTEIDEFEKALRIANSIQQEDLKDKILMGIILKLVQAKKFNKALEIVKLLKNESNKTQSLIEIGKLYSKTDANGTKILHELISLN
ncbi:hypothetical protein IT568_13360, partial [bacterium]|nr:hypothetical protein [bacterium]